MTSLLIEALPVAIALTALAVVALVIPVLLALDLFFAPDKKRPQPCEARARDRSRR